MATVRSLYVSLKAQTDDYNKKIREAQQLTKDWNKIIRPTAELMGQIGKTALVAGGLVTTALVGMAKRAADYGDEMLEASQKTGIGVKQLSALRLIADQSGSSFEGITAGVGKLSKAMFEAATKGGEAAKTFAALGISVKDAGGHVRQASDVLPEIAERFSKMKDGTEKTALAMRLFGKAGADMIPALNQGAEGIRRATELTEKYNVAMTDAEAKMGDEFNDTVAETGLAMQGLANQIGKALLPAMTRMVEIGNNVIAMVSKWAKENPGLTRTVAALAAALAGGGGLLIAMSGFMLIAPRMIGNIKLMADAFLALSLPVRIAVVALAALTAAFIAFPKIRGPVIETLAKINQLVFANIDLFGRLAGVLLTLAQGKFRDAWETLKGLPDQVMQSWEDRGNMVRNMAKGIGDSVTDMNKALKGDPNVLGWAKNFSVDMDALGKDANKTKELIDQMWSSLKRENGEVDALTAVLMRAKAAHIDYNQVLDKLGPTIADVADEFVRSGEPLPEIIAYYNSLRNSSLELAAAQEEELQSRIELNKAIFEGQQMMAREAANLPGELMENARQQIEAVQVVHDELTQSIVDATANLGKQEMAIRRDAAAIAELSRRGMTAAQIEAALGVNIERVSEAARDLGIQLDPVTAKVMRQQVEVDKLRRSWGEAFARLSDQLVDMVVDFDFSFRRLKEIGMNTAKDLMRSFLDGFFKPFKDGLRDLGEKAGQWAAGLIFGTKQAAGGQSSGGLLSGILGGGGGGILGGLIGPRGEGQQGGLGGILGGILGNGDGPWSERIKGILGGGVSGTGGTVPGMSMGLPGEGYAALAASVINVAAGGFKPGQKAQDVGSQMWKDFFDTINKIQGDAMLSATNKLKLIDNIATSTLAQITQQSGVDKNFAKALAGTSARINQAVIDKHLFLDPIAAQEAAARGETSEGRTGGTTIHNTWEIHFDGPVSDPESIEQSFTSKIIPLFNRAMTGNTGGIATTTTEVVLKTQGAIVAH